jgi:DnaJ-domain-containing protein 1
VIPLLLGGAALFALLGGLRAFERADVRTIKSLLAWIAALGGLVLALLLVLTGKGMIALSALVMFGPLLWERFRVHTAPRAPSSGGAMTREEAYAVLGLAPGATEAAILAAHRRLMRGAHPDAGGSDWLAARINQARDVLLSRGR